MNMTMEGTIQEQSPTSPLNLVSIDEMITEEITTEHSSTERSTLDMNTIMKRLEDPKSVSVLASITG